MAPGETNCQKIAIFADDTLAIYGGISFFGLTGAPGVGPPVIF